MSDKDVLIQELRLELEAAKRDLMVSQRCLTCKNYNIKKVCKDCKHSDTYTFKSKWEWRGVCAQNTPSLRG